MAKVLQHKYELTIGKNSRLFVELKPENGGPFPQQKRNSDNFFDILTDYTYHKYDVVAVNKYREFILDQTRPNDITIIPPKALTITDLHIEFDCNNGKNSKTANSNMAKARIFNLSEGNRDFITVGSAFILKAGYESDGDELPLIYVGQIHSVSSKRLDHDVVTEILIKPDKLLEDIKINRSYPPRATIRQILEDLLKVAASKGLPTGAFFTNDSYYAVLNREYAFGFNVTGPLVEAIQHFCSNNGYQAYVVKGKLYLQPKEFDEYRKVVSISQENVKGSIERLEDSTGTPTSSSGTSRGRGIKLTVNLSGDIDTTTLIKIVEGDYIGIYNPVSIKHRLQYEGDSWDTTIEAVKVSRL